MSIGRGLEDDFGDPDRNSRGGWFARIAHVVLPVMLVVMAMRAVNAFTNLPDWLMLANSVAWIVVIVTSTRHIQLARICLRCMEDVPADAPVRAQRRRPQLWFEHESRRVWVASLICGFIISTPVLLHWLLYRDLPDHDVHDNWTILPGDLVLALWIYGSVLHHRLQPWCPYCRGWDEGGERERTPTPDPTGSKVA